MTKKTGENTLETISEKYIKMAISGEDKICTPL